MNLLLAIERESYAGQAQLIQAEKAAKLVSGFWEMWNSGTGGFSEALVGCHNLYNRGSLGIYWSESISDWPVLKSKGPMLNSSLEKACLLRGVDFHRLNELKTKF